jgi:DNA-binding HxlR family transcriptional regulator
MSGDEQLLIFFKALADATRLKIVGLLAQKSLSVEELATLLALRPSTVSHHLSMLSDAGLVSARAESYYNVYQLESKVLEEMSHHLLAHDTLPAAAAMVDINAYDRQVLNDFLLPDGHLKAVPAQRKKREAVLRHVLQAFEPGIRYSEKQVNEILVRFHHDTATLRRELIVYKMLARESGEYWRTDQH